MQMRSWDPNFSIKVRPWIAVAGFSCLFLLSHARFFSCTYKYIGIHRYNYYVLFRWLMSRKSKRQLALTHNCRHVVEFSAEPGNLKTIIQMISLCAASSSSSKSLLWLAMIFPTLEFLISRCEHQFDVHQSPPAKYTVRRQSKPTRLYENKL